MPGWKDLAVLCAVDISDSLNLSVFQSKGGILAKACEYIQELRNSNIRLSESVKDNERMVVDSELLRSQVEELKKQNDMFRSIFIQKGIPIPPDLLSDAV